MLTLRRVGKSVIQSMIWLCKTIWNKIGKLCHTFFLMLTPVGVLHLVHGIFGTLLQSPGRKSSQQGTPQSVCEKKPLCLSKTNVYTYIIYIYNYIYIYIHITAESFITIQNPSNSSFFCLNVDAIVIHDAALLLIMRKRMPTAIQQGKAAQFCLRFWT